MTTFLFTFAWGVLAFFFVLLVRIGAHPVPKPPKLLRFTVLGTWPREITSWAATTRSVLTTR